MLLFTSFKTLGIFALTLCAVSNAAPYLEIRDDFSLVQPRGNLPSILKPKPKESRPCPTVQEAIKLSKIQSLPNALFWSGVSTPQVEALTKSSGRKQLRDLFPDDIRTDWQYSCSKAGKNEWMIMSEAMATIASGEAWVLKDSDAELKAANAKPDPFWEHELATMKSVGKVTKLYRVDKGGNVLEQIPLR